MRTGSACQERSSRTAMVSSCSTSPHKLRRTDMAKAKPDPNKIYVAWTGFAVEGVPGVTPKGTRLRGSAPAVQRAFQFFVEDGTPSGEWPSEFDRGVQESERTDRADRAAAARREAPPIP